MGSRVLRLENKVLLYQTGAYNLHPYAKQCEFAGMKIVGDGGHDDTFANQFCEVMASAGLWCALYPADAQSLLTMPDDVLAKVVVLTNIFAIGNPKMREPLGVISQKTAGVLREEYYEGWYFDLTRLLIQAVQAKTTT